MNKFVLLLPIFFYYFLTTVGLRILNLNINGINDQDKQIELVNFINLNRLDVIMLQEHNLRNKSLLSKVLLDSCHIFINLAINQKGGTAILFNKKLHFNIVSEEKSADSRIISVKINLYGNVLQFVNIYAHSGSNSGERDDLFQNELLFYLRNNLNNTVLGGDFNCILSKRDSTSNSVQVSKVLINIIKSLQLKDAWYLKNNDVQYTFFRQNYGSRLDRFYIKNLENYINEIKLIHVNFSDHSSILMTLDIPNVPKTGTYYWKLNVSLLDNVNIKNNFKNEWERIKAAIGFYSSINIWWEKYAKRQIKLFFKKVGKVENAKTYGLLQFLEHKLNRIYDKCNRTGELNYLEVKMLKDRINQIKTLILEGVKIRARVAEQIEGEKVSNHLIRGGKRMTKLIKSKLPPLNLVLLTAS